MVVGQTDEVLKVGVVVAPGLASLCGYRQSSRRALPRRIMAPGGSGECQLWRTSSVLTTTTAVRKAAAETKGKIAYSPCTPCCSHHSRLPRPLRCRRRPLDIYRGRVAPAGSKGPLPQGSRLQVRRILVSCASVQDGRAGAGNASFEIAPSPEFKESGPLPLSVDKGSRQCRCQCACGYHL